MNLFNKILIPVDFSKLSEIAIAKAVETALQCGSAELHLVCVINLSAMGYFITPETGMALTLPSINEQQDLLKEKMADLERSIKENCSIKLMSTVLTGNMVDVLNDYVAAYSIDLIVIATINTTGLKEFIFGSEAQHIVSKANCPVLTIQPYTAHESMQKIILPVEGFYPENKLHYAIELAQLFNAEIHLLCLTEKANSVEHDSYSIINCIIEKFEEKHIAYKVKKTEEKNITEMILQYSETGSIDLILVNPGEQSKLTGKYIETTGGHLVNHASVPVLTIKKKNN